MRNGNDLPNSSSAAGQILGSRRGAIRGSMLS
jgi:hypothetical protein